jgi:uncharacterized membrane protein YhaH (DUF805 family)
MTWYIKVLKNYANFKGRARRREFWMFNVVHALICIGVWSLIFAYITSYVITNSKMVEMAEAAPPVEFVFLAALLAIYYIAMKIPCFAVGVRRMHDTGHSGWWVLCPLIRWYWAVKKGDAGPNQYGDDPQALPRRRLRALSVPASAAEIQQMEKSVEQQNRERLQRLLGDGGWEGK